MLAGGYVTYHYCIFIYFWPEEMGEKFRELVPIYASILALIGDIMNVMIGRFRATPSPKVSGAGEATSAAPDSPLRAIHPPLLSRPRLHYFPATTTHGDAKNENKNAS